MNMFKIGIRKKLILSLSFMLVSFLLISGFINNKIEETYLLKDIRSQVTKLQIDTLTLRRNEKDFLLREDSKYIKRHQDNYKLFVHDIQELEENSKDFDFIHFEGLKENTKEYAKTFLELSQNMIRLNQMREHYKNNYDMNDVIESFILLPNEYNYKKVISNNLTNYNTSFSDIILLNNKIGLKYNEGLKGKVREHSHLFEEQLKSSLENVETEVQKTISDNKKQYLNCFNFICCFNCYLWNKFIFKHF